MPTYKRRDSNQEEIVNLLKDIPTVEIADTANLGNGYPDLTVGYGGDKVFLFELKDGNKYPSQRQLSNKEKVFFKKWYSYIGKTLFIVKSFEEILEAFQGFSSNETLQIKLDIEQGLI